MRRSLPMSSPVRRLETDRFAVSRWMMLAALSMTAACAGGPVRTSMAVPGAQGISYCLPRTLIETTVTVTEVPATSTRAAQFDVRVAVLPHTIADSRHEFAL